MNTGQSDLESERALLGAILLEPERVIALCQKKGLSPGDFTEEKHRKIFAAMMTMHAAGKPIDTVTVQRETGIDIMELNGLLDSCPTWAHAEFYIEQIKEAAAKRKLELLPAMLAGEIKAGKTAGEISAKLLSEVERIAPAGQDTEQAQIKARFFSILQLRGLSRAEQFKQMTDIVLEYLHKRGRFFFHAEHKTFKTAMYFDGTRKLLLQIDADEFQAWLSHFIGINRIEPAYKSIYSALLDEALNGQTTGLYPETYWTARLGAVYVSNGDGQAVKITAGKYCLVDNGTDDVLFAAGRTLKPWKLIDPIDPVQSCRLFRDMKATAKHAIDLFRLWLCSLPTNQRCKPPLTLSGAIGSGKTRLALGIFELYGIDPRVTIILRNSEDDFWAELNRGGLICFDNADTRIDWLPDALAAAATAVMHEKRQLYTDSDIVQQQAHAWIVITSANPTFASDPGLADRVLVLRLERREKDTAEAALSAEIALHRNAGLSWIINTLSKALADNNPTPENLNRRHPDFAAFAVKIGRAIGREQEAIAALQAAESDKSQFNLENDDMGSALLELIARQESFSGTAAELLEVLKDNESYFANWGAKKIAKRLNKLKPHLESIFETRYEKDRQGIMRYSFRLNAGYAGFQPPVSAKVPMRKNIESFLKQPLEYQQTQQPDQDFDIKEGKELIFEEAKT